MAPSCTAPAISCIFWVPLPVASTALTRAAAKPSATSAMTSGDDDVGQVLAGKGQLAARRG